MNKHLLTLCVFLWCEFDLISQNEASKWHFGHKLAVDFMSSPPSVLNNSSIITEEGCSSIADPSGNLLFYTSGDTIWNRLHLPMANGTGLFGHKSAFQHVIVKLPSSSSIYYVFTNSVGSNNGGGLLYSVVDMALAGGNGSVTIKNLPLFTPGLEKVAAVLHCNRNDVWVVSHENNTSNFRSYLLTSSGLNTVPVISNVGPVLTYSAYGGQIKLSPTGRRAAMGLSSGVTNVLGDYLLFDFDDATGILSNMVTLPRQLWALPAAPISSEFSADGAKLYAIADGMIYQWNICAGSSSAIVASKDSIPGHDGRLQLAPNGKIYATFQATTSSLSVINAPGNSLPSAGFVSQSISLGTNKIWMSLPSIMSSYLKKLNFTSSVASCGAVSFSVPQLCDAQIRPPQSITWDFGDPASGAANTTTLNNTSHTYSTNGNYNVKLILHNSCGTDTISQLVAVAGLPQLALSGKTIICKGETTTFTVSGAATYSWNGTAGTSTVSFSPSITTVYSVSGTSTASCLGSKSFTVTVEPCPGFKEFTTASGSISIFPNPVTSILQVRGGAGQALKIMDLTGRVHILKFLVAENEEVDVSGLVSGLWLIEVNGPDHRSCVKLIKQ